MPLCNDKLRNCIKKINFESTNPLLNRGKDISEHVISFSFKFVAKIATTFLCSLKKIHLRRRFENKRSNENSQSIRLSFYQNR